MWLSPEDIASHRGFVKRFFPCYQHITDLRYSIAMRRKENTYSHFIFYFICLKVFYPRFLHGLLFCIFRSLFKSMAKAPLTTLK